LPLVGWWRLLFSGYTPLFSGTVGLALTVVLIFGAAVLTGVGLALRGLFWVLVGAGCAGFFSLASSPFLLSWRFWWPLPLRRTGPTAVNWHYKPWSTVRATRCRWPLPAHWWA
jgi:hypothetical protein